MKLTKITLPLLKPTTLFLLTTETISSFQVFTPVNVMTGGGPGYATTTLISLLYDNGGYQALKNAKHPRFGGDSIVYPMSELDDATLAAIREEDYDVAVLAVYNAQCVICAYEYTYLAAQELLNCLETGEFKGHLPVKLPEMTFEP